MAHTFEDQVKRAAAQLKRLFEHSSSVKKVQVRAEDEYETSRSGSSSDDTDSDVDSDASSSSFDEFAPIPLQLVNPNSTYRITATGKLKKRYSEIGRIRFRESRYKGPKVHLLQKYTHLIKPCFVKLERMMPWQLPVPPPQQEQQQEGMPEGVAMATTSEGVTGASTSAHGNYFPFLEKPKRGHHSNAQFPCHLCPNSFTFSHNLRRHLSTVHAPHAQSGGEEGSFVCEQCGKTFPRLVQLNRHLNRFHGASESSLTDADTIYCDICARPFRTKISMKNHRATHSGIKYPCEFCGREFISTTSRSIHRKIHLGHKPFACSYCGKFFQNKNSQTVHEQIHTGEKNFRCPVIECGQIFRHGLSLKIHAAKHDPDNNPDAPFKCDICGILMKTKTNLVTHENIVHSQYQSYNERARKHFQNKQNKKQQQQQSD